MRALTIAATGMSAQEQNLEVIANNIANINTTGFKRSRAEFTDLIYQTERLMGVASRGRDATIPEGAQIGLGVRTAAIRTINIQGALTNTGNTLDLAINGRGWFQVTNANGDTVYTRDGAFNTNQNGQLVTMDGYLVSPPITIPPNVTNVTVSQTGVVNATTPGQTNPQQLGQLTIANFVNDAGLQALGGNYFQQTQASGQPNVGVPGDTAFGIIQQGYIEASNVDPVTEITNLIAAQRAYEMNSKVIQAARPDVRDNLQHAQLGLRRCARNSGSPLSRRWLASSRLSTQRSPRRPSGRRRRSVIYPGDIILDEMLTDIPGGGARDGGGPFVEDRSFVVGKTARLTLLPGHAIPLAGISNRKLVANGAEVSLVYSEGGLLIVTSGAALQDGSIGEVVRVRNSDSGVTVSGAVQPDGSVKVGGG